MNIIERLNEAVYVFTSHTSIQPTRVYLRSNEVAQVYQWITSNSRIKVPNPNSAIRPRINGLYIYKVDSNCHLGVS